jgi:hypothetical protein
VEAPNDTYLTATDEMHTLANTLVDAMAAAQQGGTPMTVVVVANLLATIRVLERGAADPAEARDRVRQYCQSLWSSLVATQHANGDLVSGRTFQIEPLVNAFPMARGMCAANAPDVDAIGQALTEAFHQVLDAGMGRPTLELGLMLATVVYLLKDVPLTQAPGRIGDYLDRLVEMGRTFAPRVCADGAADAEGEP